MGKLYPISTGVISNIIGGARIEIGNVDLMREIVLIMSKRGII